MNDLRFVVFNARLIMAHNDNVTIMYDRIENKWKKSELDFSLIEMMDGKEYTELLEDDILEIYSAEVITSAKKLMKEIEEK